MHEASILFEQHSQTLMRSTRRVRGSRDLMSESWRAVAASRRRVLRWPTITGGSHGDHVRISIRARLEEHTLPLIDGRAWAGSGAGINRCVCCGAVIARGAAEFEPRDHVGLHAHAGGFAGGLTESDWLRQQERAAG